MPDDPTPALSTAEASVQPIPGQSAVETLIIRHLEPEQVAWPTDQLELQIPVEVNRGRWIVRCPDCPSAQQASFGDQRFYCTDSACPRPHGTAWYRVSWPADWQAIEARLLLRPEANRNWLPGETLDELDQENAEHVRELLPFSEGNQP